MMVSGNDPFESLLRSIQVAKDVFSPLEVGFKKATKEFELNWLGFKKGSSNAQLLRLLNDSDSVSSSKNHNIHVLGLKDSPFDRTISEDERKLSSKRVPIKSRLGMLAPNCQNSDCKVGGMRERCKGKDCLNCARFALAWSVFVDGFLRSLNAPFKFGKKRGLKGLDEGKVGNNNSSTRLAKSVISDDLKRVEMENRRKAKLIDGKKLSVELLGGHIFNNLILNIRTLDHNTGEKVEKVYDSPSTDNWKTITSILEGKKADMNVFLGNLKFARMNGAPTALAEIDSSVNEDGDDVEASNDNVETGNVMPQKLASVLLDIPLSNMERLKTVLSTVSISELIELVPQLGRAAKDVPDKKKLFSVQDFFRYTEAEGRRFFEELDRDGDGQVNIDDLEIVMRKRKLPRRYAREFLRRARSHLFAKSFGWKQFLSLMEQREATILRAYTSLCLTKSGTLQKSEILASLKNAGLPSNEDNAIAMMRFLNADTGGSISYGHFRNFMLLLPSDCLHDDPRNLWFEAATVVPVAPPVEIPTGDVLRSALAGGLASGLSTSLLHPVDTIKLRVQTSTLSFPEVISRVPQIGVQGLYRGSLPAILGQFTSHGLRTGIFEATKLVLINVAPTLPEIQVQSLASFCSTLLGTATRIPCEVLKQRLQAGLFDNVGEAIVGTWRQDGLKGFFRGTGVTLCREVPLYVAGMGLYAESKKLAQHLLGRELEPWETIGVGALSGGIAAVITTPFDVLKTRMMTAPHGRPISTSLIAFSILHQEGPLGFFKGALPRFFWVAPLGAMNFAGYELAKNAMIKSEEELVNETPTKLTDSSL